MTSHVRSALVLALLLGAPRSMLSQRQQPSAWALFSVRYDTRTSDFIYAAYGYGRVFAMVGALENPRSGYTELLGAIGRTFTVDDGPAQPVAVGIARADEDWYAQLYFVPAVHPGPVWMRATIETDFPVSRRGTLQLGVSPLSATIPIAPFAEAGLAMDLAAARGSRTDGAIGPEVRVSLPKAVLGADVQRFVSGRAARLRLFFVYSG